MPLAPGDRLGPYEILAPLGAGGMGEVYRARDPRLGRDVAIKVLPPEFAKDESRLSRFEHEAKAAGALNHPNLLTVYDVGRHEGTPYLVSELLDGATVRGRLAAGPLRVRKAVEYATQIAHGLGAAHDKGIVHRDLKPENLFVTMEDRAKILDFGLAKLRLPEEIVGSQTETATSPTSPGTFLGTVGYVSPEQVRGEPADPRSDIFAFGTVLYEMLAGKRAFRGTTAVETLNAILKEEPTELSDPDSGVPLALDRIVRRCLEKNPARRFRSAHDLAFALEGVSATSGSQIAAATGTASFRIRWPRLALPLLALALPIGGTLWGRRTADRSVPSFQRLTFRRGAVQAARFASDGRTIFYSAAWDGDPIRSFSTRTERPEPARIEIPDAQVEAVSASGEMLVRLGARHSYFDETTLAKVPMTGGGPRPLAENVVGADWGPDGSIALVRGVGDSYRLEYPLGHVLYASKEALFPPRVSPQGDRIALYAPDKGSDAVMVVDRTGAKHVLAGGFKWHGRYVAWSPSGDEVWFAASAGGYAHPLRAVTLSGKERVLLNLPGTTMIEDLAPDGRVLLTSGPLRMITKCLRSGETQERDLSGFDATSAHTIAPDGQTVLLGEHGLGSGPGRDSAIYIRKTDASPPIRLGEGHPRAMSPDGLLVLARSEQTHQWSLLPTGPGEARPLDLKTVDPYVAGWYPDSQHLLLAAAEPAGSWGRCFSLDIHTGVREPVTPQGFFCPLAPAPDGKTLLVQNDKEVYLTYSLADGRTRAIPGLTKEDEILQWSADSRFLFVQQAPLPRARIDRLDLATGRRSLFREIALSEPAGLVPETSGVRLGPDGTYCYAYMQVQADLYLFEGIR